MKKVSKRISITLDDIAKRLNVSKVTVSKALRGHSDISKETADKVKEVAAELGYTPNLIARNFSSNKSSTIGVVVPKIVHYFFSSVIEAIFDTAFKNNYEIILNVSQENSEKEKKHIESLLEMRVDGLIVSVTQETHDTSIFERVLKLGIPLVFIDRVLDVDKASKITVDDVGGSYRAVESAVKNGYTKIGHIGGYQNIYIGKNRFEGFKTAMKNYELEINDDWIVFGGFEEKDGYRGFMKMYKSGKLPEFVFAVTYPVALGMYQAVNEVGLKIPDDIDIICFGDSDVNRFIKPKLSCVDQPTESLGRKAVELIVQNINYLDEFEPVSIELPTKIIQRETCLQKKII